MKLGDGGDLHSRLHGLLDQPDLFIGSIAPTALHAGDDYNTLNELRHRRIPRLEPRPSRLRQIAWSHWGLVQAMTSRPAGHERLPPAVGRQNLELAPFWAIGASLAYFASP
jgi:hypothetical protein